MPFYVEKPQDKNGYRHYPCAVIKANSCGTGWLFVSEPKGFPERVHEANFVRISNRAGKARYVKNTEEMDTIRAEYALRTGED